MNRPVSFDKNYAPFGVGDKSNQFWIHIGSYSAPFATLEAAKRFGRESFHMAGCYIRRRDGQLMATKDIGCQWEDA